MLEQDIARALLEIEAVQFRPDDPVTFKSGMISPVYVDNRRLIFHPHAWSLVIEGFRAHIAAQGLAFDVIAGIEAAGIPHSSVLAYTLGAPSVFVRKQAKEHGLKSAVEGGDVTGQRVLLVEDMVTTGGSSLKGVESLRERLANLPAELPDEIAELRERFTPEELRKVAEAYLKVASDLYTSLAERGEETVERIRRTPAVEESLERANSAANDVVDLTEQALGTVASQTRAVGERAAALAGLASDKVREGADEISDAADELAENIDEAGDEAKDKAVEASDKVSGVAGKVAAKTRSSANSPIKKTPAPAKKTAPAPAAKKTAPAPAKKAPAKKTTR